MYVCNNCKQISIFTKIDLCIESIKCTKCGGQFIKVEDTDDMSEIVSEEK
jgi:rRNA maturation endonuclease Nob1